MCKKFIPTYHFKSIFQIDYKALKETGIKYLMFDLDNTLIPYHESMPNEELNKLKEELINLGFKLLIVSNSRKIRVKNFSDAFNMNSVQFAKKPFKKGFKIASKLLEVNNPDEVLFIGDQLLTDVFGANRMKFRTALVDPLNRETEALITKINRIPEWVIAKLTGLFHPRLKARYKEYSEVSND